MPRKTTVKVKGVFEKIPGSGIWWIRWKQDGVLHRERVGGKQNAIDLYQRRKADAMAGVKLPSNLRYKGTTLAQLCDEAMAWYKEHRPKSARAALSRIGYIKKHLGDRQADQLTPQDIDLWLTSHEEWSPASKNRVRTFLSRIYALAMSRDKVVRNPARLVAPRRENNARIRYLKDDEEVDLREAIMQRCPSHMASFVVALHTGMRKGEQFTLEWDQIDWDRRAIHLTMTKNRSQRDIPMSRTCEKALRELWEKRESRIQAGESVNDRVFQSDRYDAPIRDPKKWFEGAVREAQIENFVWHDLRHTFCSRLVMRGVDIRTVAEVAGHKSISVTMRYTHLAPEHNQAAVLKLDD